MRNCVNCTDIGAEQAIYGNTYLCENCKPKKVYTMRVKNEKERTTVYACLSDSCATAVQIIASATDGVQSKREEDLYSQMRERGFDSYIPLVSEQIQWI